MRKFDLSSGTVLNITDKVIEIIREDGKSGLKAFTMGRTMGRMIIKLESISGIINFADYLVLCGHGLPTPSDFKLTSIVDIKQYPNCLVGKEEELKLVYEYLSAVIED